MAKFTLFLFSLVCSDQTSRKRSERDFLSLQLVSSRLGGVGAEGRGVVCQLVQLSSLQGLKCFPFFQRLGAGAVPGMEPQLPSF